MERLIDLSMEDERLSDDEKEILFDINHNLSNYAELIMQTISDGEIDLTEMSDLKEMEKKIVNDALSIAKKDEVISDDERTIINELVATIQSI